MWLHTWVIFIFVAQQKDTGQISKSKSKIILKTGKVSLVPRNFFNPRSLHFTLYKGGQFLVIYKSAIRKIHGSFPLQQIRKFLRYVSPQIAKQIIDKQVSFLWIVECNTGVVDKYERVERASSGFESHLFSRIGLKMSQKQGKLIGKSGILDMFSPKLLSLRFTTFAHQNYCLWVFPIARMYA